MLYIIYLVVCILHKHCMYMYTGILKVMSKMGISTLQSYKGAQVFEALGRCLYYYNIVYKDVYV